MSGQPTLRTHLEAIRALPCLNLLDEAKIDILKSVFVEIPGRETEDALRLDPARRYRSVFDPDPLPACSSASTPPHTHKETTT